jgi:CP family cyanate transporter-like MFS transporter
MSEGDFSPSPRPQPRRPSRPSGPRPLWAGRTTALLGILLVALSLRTAVAALSPIVDHITGDVPFTNVDLAIVGSAPPIAFAVAGLLTPLLARRIGLETALLLAVATMIVGHLGRALAPSSTLLVLATVVTLLGVGVGNVLLPPAVKRYFPDRVGLVTAVYATILSISTAVPALVAVPIADAAGWRASLGVWFVVALTAAIPWIPLAARARRRAGASPAADPDAGHNAVETGAIDLAHAEAARTEAAVDHAAPEDPGARLGRRMLRSPTAWAITAIFTVSTVLAYSGFAWFPSLLVERAGVTPAEAGTLLALFAITGFPCSLIVPVIATRVRSVAPIVLAATAFGAAGILGLLFLPTVAPWLWVILTGLGTLTFPLSLVLINLRTHSASGSIVLSGFVQGIGYTIGTAGPLVVGLLYEATGDWTAPLWFMLVVVALTLPAAAVLARPRFVEDEVSAALQP